jgi:uncharacterized Zn finger protein
MSEEGIFCPSCDAETEHAVVKSGQEQLVRCEECGTVHPVASKRTRLSNLKVIVNRDGVSTPYYINLPSDDDVEVGKELLVDDASRDVVFTEVASIETDRRVEKAKASEIKTVWARAIDEVPVKFSIYKSGKTRPLKSTSPGDEMFSVGDVRKVEGLKFEITKIKLRNEGFSDQAEAKDILRIWGREI